MLDLSSSGECLSSQNNNNKIFSIIRQVKHLTYYIIHYSREARVHTLLIYVMQIKASLNVAIQTELFLGKVLH